MRSTSGLFCLGLAWSEQSGQRGNLWRVNRVGAGGDVGMCAGGRARGGDTVTAAVAGGAGGALVVSRSRPAVEVDKCHKGAQRPYRLLAAAIVQRAMVEAMAGNIEARRWLLSDPLAAYLGDALDLDRARLIRAVCASTAAVAVVSDD